MDNISRLNQALEFISKPTAKRLRLAHDILAAIIYSEMKGVCNPCEFKFFRFEHTDKVVEPLVKLKKFICAICPSCGCRLFDLNTEIMKGQCLSCSYKSENYQLDMINRKLK